METVSATEARVRFFDLLKDSLRKSKSYRISYKKGGVILLSEEEYESLMETLYLLESPGFRKAFRRARKEIDEGKTVPLSKVFPR